MLPPTSAENDFPFRESPKKHADTAVVTGTIEAMQQKQQRKRPAYPNGAPFTHHWFPVLPQAPPPPSSLDPPLSANFGTPGEFITIVCFQSWFAHMPSLISQTSIKSH